MPDQRSSLFSVPMEYSKFDVMIDGILGKIGTGDEEGGFTDSAFCVHFCRISRFISGTLLQRPMIESSVFECFKGLVGTVAELSGRIIFVFQDKTDLDAAS